MLDSIVAVRVLNQIVDVFTNKLNNKPFFVFLLLDFGDQCFKLEISESLSEIINNGYVTTQSP